MFSVSTAVVLLVFFVSQALGQTSSTVSLSVIPSPSPTVVSSGTVSAAKNLPSTTLPITSSTTIKTSEQPTISPSIKTCAKLGVVIDKPWNDTYKNSKSENNQTLSHAFSSALKKLFSDVEKYIDVEVNFTETEQGFVLASAKLCLVFKEGDVVFIEDLFKDKVETGKLDTDLPVKKDSAKFDPLGVSFVDWKAKKEECKKCAEGAAGPFSIVKECEPEKGFSCDGLKEPTEETKKCPEYCSSTVAAVSVSFAILVIGIFLSSSFQ